MGDSGAIRGQVTNQRDGQPIDGAKVNLSVDGGPEVGSKTTDAKGEFHFGDLDPGNYEMLVEKKGFEDGLYGPLFVGEGLKTELNLALQPKNE